MQDEEKSIDDVIGAWRQATEELNLHIEAPFVLHTKDGREVTFGLLIRYFGSSLGTLILLTDDMTEFDTPEEYGYYCSALNADSYGTYRRENIVDTLQDWGYYGPPQFRPDWYVAQPPHE